MKQRCTRTNEKRKNFKVRILEELWREREREREREKVDCLSELKVE